MFLVHAKGQASKANGHCQGGNPLSLRHFPTMVPSEDHLEIREELKSKLEGLPRSPGVYLFKDGSGKVIYVGKAKSLRQRVRSYFLESRVPDPKTELLVRKAADLDYLVLGSEMEALVAENNFIKEYSPRYNIRLKDDKSYPYLRVTLEEELPRIFPTRHRTDSGSLYLGPYTDVGALRQTLRVLKTLFPLRDCPGDVTFRSLERECLYYHIDRCKAPCTGRQTVEEYRADLDRVLLFLTGKTEQLSHRLEKDMAVLSEDLRFEEAARLRDQITSLERLSHRHRTQVYGGGDRDTLALARDREDCCAVVLRFRGGKLLATETFHFKGTLADSDASVLGAFFQQYYHRVDLLPPEVLVPLDLESSELLAQWLSEKRGSKVDLRRPQRGLGRELVSLALDNARSKLDEILAAESGKSPGLPPEIFELREQLNLEALPRVIEGIDISNTGDSEVVASLVSFHDGQARKGQYRKYKIKTVEGQDDVASIYEVVHRRFKRLQDEQKRFPDLLLIDGGKGQLGAAEQALHELGIKGQPLISLAKREEEVFCAGTDGEALILPPSSGALKLLQRVRDEAHRFARDFHRQRRGKASISSALDEIPGLGPARRDLLLQYFGDLRGIRNAKAYDLRKVPGIGAALAQTILESLKDKP